MKEEVGGGENQRKMHRGVLRTMTRRKSAKEDEVEEEGH